MNKLFTGIIAVVGLMVMSGAAEAYMDNRWSPNKWIKADKVEVRLKDQISVVACTIPYGTMVQTKNYHAPGNWGHSTTIGNWHQIRVMDGPKRGCTGLFRLVVRLGGARDLSNVRVPPRTPAASSTDQTTARTNNQTIFTTGRWGTYVPVFKSRNDFFNARDRNKIENVVCQLKKGMQVKFTPYRDWGVGEVERDNCKGWIDRGVIR